jgi:hypothetical protein
MKLADSFGMSINYFVEEAERDNGNHTRKGRRLIFLRGQAPDYQPDPGHSGSEFCRIL